MKKEFYKKSLLLKSHNSFSLIIHNNFLLFLGKTSLFLAAEGGHTKAVELLLEYGADINAKNLDGLIHSIFFFY